jgi:hypothetical protein
MSTVSIRQKLHSYLEVANDKKVKAIYAIMENEIEETGIEYTAAVKKELEIRIADYKNGKAKIFTAGESKKRVEKILNTAGKR